MDGDASDSGVDNSKVKPERNKTSAMEKLYSEFDLQGIQANDEVDHDDTDGITTAEAKRDLNSCKAVDAIPTTSHDRNSLHNYIEYCTTDTNIKNDNLLDQPAKENSQILNLSSSKDCFQDSYVRGCPSQTTNASLTDLAVKIFEQNKDFDYVSAAKKNIDALSKQTTDSDILVCKEIGSNLKTCDTKLFVTSENAPSDSGTQLDKQSKHSLSTDDQILPSSSHEKTVQNIANTNTYNNMSQEANSGEAFFAYNFKGKEEKETTDLRKDQTVFVSDKDEECNISINAEESYEQFEYVLNERKKLCAQENVMEDQTSCSLWKILNELECPFTWLADVPELDLPFSRASRRLMRFLEGGKRPADGRTTLFQEICGYLILAYEKASENCLGDSIPHLSYCYAKLGNPQFIPDGMQLEFKEMHVAPGKGNEYYMKMKRRRRAQAKDRMLQCFNTFTGRNIREFYEFNNVENSTFVTEPNSLGINNKETACSKGTMLNINDIKNPTVGSEEDSKCDSKDTNKTIGSSLPPSDESLDIKSEETDIDKTEEVCQETSERKAAYLYVVTATVAYVAYFCESYEESYVAAQVCKYWYSQLGKSGMATLLGMKGSVFLESSSVGYKLALPLFKEAVRLEPDYWQWNFLYAKNISIVNRIEKGRNIVPENEVLELVEKAVELNPNEPLCLMLLAKMYMSLSKRKQTSGENAGQKTEHIQTHLLSTTNPSCTLDHYKKSCSTQNVTSSHMLKLPEKNYALLAQQLNLRVLNLVESSATIIAQCGRNLASLPFPYRDKERGKKAILHALTLGPNNSSVNDLAGLFYEYSNDATKALEYYKRAISKGTEDYRSEMDYMRMKLRLDPGASPVIHIDRLLYKYCSPHSIVKTLCMKGYYLYKIERKILLAIRSVTIAIIMNPTDFVLKNFQPSQFMEHNAPKVNMYELLEEMLHNFWQSPPRIFNQQYWNDILETARKLTKEYRSHGKDSADAVKI